MRCEEARNKILEQTLEGEFIAAGALGEHLRECPTCRAFLSRVNEVDVALRDLPLETAPLRVSQQLLAQVTAADRQEAPLIHWAVWLPMASLLLGLLWIYLTLVWPSGAEVLRSVDPTVAGWLVQFEQWATHEQAMLSAVAISVGTGLFITLLAVGLGLYVGRNRVAASHGHSHY